MNAVIFQRVNICSSDSEINVKILSGGEQSVSADEAVNVSDSSSMQPDVWANLGAEQPRFHLLASLA
jgi:hypothetical protein